MQTNFKILDCTIRDGGYYTNWDFDKNLVEDYLKVFNNLPIDFIEMGYRSNSMKNYLGEYFYCPVYVMEKFKSHTNKKLAIILNEKDVRDYHTNDLLEPCRGYIDLIRIAVDPKNFSRALKLAEKVKQMGFQVAFNVMYMSNWESEKDFLSEIKNVNNLVDYFYMVDSYGGVYPNDVKKSFGIVREQTDVNIGFHGHNNLQLGLINTLTAIDCGVNIVDSTVTGMGRGAGNLSTELLLTAINSKFDVEVDFNELSKIVVPFQKMQDFYGWGTNLPYMVSGANSLPQKEVMEWVTKRYYSLNSIIRALSNKSKGVQDNLKLENLESFDQKYNKVLIIGGGPTGSNMSTAIQEFIKKNDNLCLIHASSKNVKKYRNIQNLQIHCLVGNEGYRLEESFQGLEDSHKLAILPPYPRTMGTYVPESLKEVAYQLPEITFTDWFKESATALAIEAALKLNADDVYFVGYDGYTGDIKQQELELFNENEYLFKMLREVLGKNIYSLTPTLYDGLSPKSIFSII